MWQVTRFGIPAHRTAALTSQPPLLEIEIVLLLGDFELPGQVCARDAWKRCDAVLVALAPADDELIASEIDVLHPEARTFEETETRSIEQDRHELAGAAELADDGAHLVAGEHDG